MPIELSQTPRYSTSNYRTSNFSTANFSNTSVNTLSRSSSVSSVSSTSLTSVSLSDDRQTEKSLSGSVAGDNTCAVCLSDIDVEAGAGFALESCDHQFHENCIARWVKQGVHRDCPLCRKPINEDRLKRIKAIHLERFPEEAQRPDARASRQIDDLMLQLQGGQYIRIRDFSSNMCLSSFLAVISTALFVGAAASSVMLHARDDLRHPELASLMAQEAAVGSAVFQSVILSARAIELMSQSCRQSTAMNPFTFSLTQLIASNNPAAFAGLCALGNTILSHSNEISADFSAKNGAFGFVTIPMAVVGLYLSYCLLCIPCMMCSNGYDSDDD